MVPSPSESYVGMMAMEDDLGGNDVSAMMMMNNNSNATTSNNNNRRSSRISRLFRGSGGTNSSRSSQGVYSKQRIIKKKKKKPDVNNSTASSHSNNSAASSGGGMGRDSHIFNGKYNVDDDMSGTSTKSCLVLPTISTKKGSKQKKKGNTSTSTSPLSLSDYNLYGDDVHVEEDSSLLKSQQLQYHQKRKDHEEAFNFADNYDPYTAASSISTTNNTENKNNAFSKIDERDEDKQAIAQSKNSNAISNYNNVNISLLQMPVPVNRKDEVYRSRYKGEDDGDNEEGDTNNNIHNSDDGNEDDDDDDDENDNHDDGLVFIQTSGDGDIIRKSPVVVQNNNDRTSFTPQIETTTITKDGNIKRRSTSKTKRKGLYDGEMEPSFRGQEATVIDYNNKNEIDGGCITYDENDGGFNSSKIIGVNTSNDSIPKLRIFTDEEEEEEGEESNTSQDNKEQEQDGKEEEKGEINKQSSSASTPVSSIISPLTPHSAFFPDKNTSSSNSDSDNVCANSSISPEQPYTPQTMTTNADDSTRSSVNLRNMQPDFFSSIQDEKLPVVIESQNQEKDQEKGEEEEGSKTDEINNDTGASNATTNNKNNDADDDAATADDEIISSRSASEEHLQTQQIIDDLEGSSTNTGKNMELDASNREERVRSLVEEFIKSNTGEPKESSIAKSSDKNDKVSREDLARSLVEECQQKSSEPIKQPQNEESPPSDVGKSPKEDSNELTEESLPVDYGVDEENSGKINRNISPNEQNTPTRTKIRDTNLRKIELLNMKAVQYVDDGDYEQAINTFESVLHEYIKHYETNVHPTIASAHHNIGMVYYNRASILLKQQIMLNKSNIHNDGIHENNIQQEKEECVHKSMYHFQAAARAARDSLGANHPNVAVSLVRIGFLLLNHQKSYGNAIITFEEALRIRTEHYGPNHSLVANLLNNIGVCLMHVNKFKDGLQKLENALSIQEVLLQDLHTELYKIKLEEHLSQERRNNSCNSSQRSKSRSSRRSRNSSHDNDDISSINENSSDGDDDRATRLLNQVQKGQMEIAETLCNIGGLFLELIRHQNNYDKLHESQRRKKHEDRQNVAHDQILFMTTMDASAHSEDAFSEALRIREGILGDSHELVKQTRSLCGTAHNIQKRCRNTPKKI